MRKRVAVLGFAVVLAGCTSRIPSSVSADEYALYAEWMKHYFAKGAPANLYVESQTFVFDPLERFGCGNTMHDKARVPWSLIKQLHALGQAEYRLNVGHPGASLHVPWDYKVVEHPALVSEDAGRYRLIAFSRVAFNRGHNKALFAFSNSCGGECGVGGAVYAHKDNGNWAFERTGCDWLY